jgi:hypothetical protein
MPVTHFCEFCPAVSLGIVPAKKEAYYLEIHLSILAVSADMRCSSKLLARLPNAKVGPGFESRLGSLGGMSALSSSGEDKPKGLLYNCAF